MATTTEQTYKRRCRTIVSVNEFLNGHYNEGVDTECDRALCFSERIPKWPLQPKDETVYLQFSSFSERIPKWPLQPSIGQYRYEVVLFQ